VGAAPDRRGVKKETVAKVSRKRGFWLVVCVNKKGLSH